MHDGEQIFTSKTLPHQPLLGRDRHRVGVLNQQRLDGRAIAQRRRITGKDAADLRLIELADRRILRLRPVISVLSMEKMLELEWNAPPPSCCHRR